MNKISLYFNKTMYIFFPYSSTTPPRNKPTYRQRSFISILKFDIIDNITTITVVVMIIWQLDLQLPVQSVPITTTVVSGEVYSIQNYVIKFVNELQQVSDFLRFPPPIKLTATTNNYDVLLELDTQYSYTMVRLTTGSI